MKGRKKILLLALFAVATLVFSACSKTQTNNDFSVGGIVITDAEFFEISILVNGIKTDYSLDSSGCFNISHLKSGDVITFSKEGYSFNSYTVGGFSVDGIEIVGTKCRYDVLTFFDENYGTVSGAGKYEYGETKKLTVTPNEHFEIDGIYEKDNLVSSNSEYSFTVTDDRVFVVRFSKKKYPITIEKTNEECVVVAPESAAFDEEITVYASDDENSYSNKKVAFDGIVARKNGNTVYVESLDPDPETGLYYGMTCYIGYQSGDILEILKIGNYVRMVGTVQYYEAGQSYQISGISYSAYDTDNPDNLKLIDDTTRVPSYQALDVDKFADGTTVSVEFDKDEDTIETKQYKYSDLIMNSTISCKNLTVVDAYTTDDEESSSYGAITLTCETENGKTITIRTA
ncbi:MAG: hypothetical protein MR961_05200, partial [Clostridiales bacterium]|nr:hypothetical protein [Clostridiales bacterium]